MGMKKNLSTLIFLTLILAFGSLIYLGGESFRAWKTAPVNVEKPRDFFTLVKNTLKLSVMDVEFSWLYEVTNEDLKIHLFSVPFTSQRSLIEVRGRGSYGFDLEKLVVQEKAPDQIYIQLPEPELQNLDLKFTFLDENDTFLNRISIEDRNRMMSLIRKRVQGDLNHQAYRAKAIRRGREAIDLLRSILQVEIHVKNSV